MSKYLVTQDFFIIFVLEFDCSFLLFVIKSIFNKVGFLLGHKKKQGCHHDNLAPSFSN